MVYVYIKFYMTIIVVYNFLFILLLLGSKYLGLYV